MTDEELIAQLRVGPEYVYRFVDIDHAAADRIAALTAQNREMALDVLASSGQAQEAYAAQIAAEAEAAALRERVARLEGALAQIDALDPEKGYIGTCSENAIRGLVLRMGEIARAALTDGGTEYERKVAQMKKDFPNGI